VGQAVIQHESLFKVSNLLDQFKDGLKSVGILTVLQKFPQLFIHFFTFTGNVSTEDVIEALFVHKDDVVDTVLMALICKYVSELSSEGTWNYIV